MAAITISVLRSDAAGHELRPGETVAFHNNGYTWRAVLVEHGIASGQPSVAILVPVPGGEWEMAVFETSLLVFQAAARSLVAMAETQLGWEMPA